MSKFSSPAASQGAFILYRHMDNLSLCRKKNQLIITCQYHVCYVMSNLWEKSVILFQPFACSPFEIYLLSNQDQSGRSSLHPLTKIILIISLKQTCEHQRETQL